MKHLLLTTIAAVVLVGCATTQSPEPPTTKVQVRGSDREGELDVPILAAAYNGNIEAVKQHLAAGTDVNVKGVLRMGLLCIMRLLTVTRKSPNC